MAYIFVLLIVGVLSILHPPLRRLHPPLQSVLLFMSVESSGVFQQTQPVQIRNLSAVHPPFKILQPVHRIGIVHPPFEAVIHPLFKIILQPVRIVVVHPPHETVIHPLFKIILQPVLIGVLHPLLETVIHPLVTIILQPVRIGAVQALLEFVIHPPSPLLDVRGNANFLPLSEESNNSGGDTGSDGEEPPIVDNSIVETAKFLLSHHPLKKFERLNRWTKHQLCDAQQQDIEPVDTFLRSLCDLPFCFNFYHRRFTSCTCLRKISEHFLFEDVAQMLGK